MPKGFSIRRLFHRFFPRKAANLVRETGAVHLSLEQKREMALDALVKGELMLHRGDLAALPLFSQACELDPENATIWLRQAWAFFEHGARLGQEKTLLLACKYFKLALQHDETLFGAWDGWASSLMLLGRVHGESHFFLEAREKLEKALSVADGQSATMLAELHWDLGSCLFAQGSHSGEALDFRLACQALERAASLDPKLPSEFWNDMAAAQMELGFLLNDQHLLDQATDVLEKALRERSRFVEGWESLAEIYGQMYLSSMDERFVTKADVAYGHVTELDPQRSAAWLRWAELLAETGRLNGDTAALAASVEKCRKALTLDTKTGEPLAQLIVSLSTLGMLTGELKALLEADDLVKRALERFPYDLDVGYAHGICLMAYARYFHEDRYNEEAIAKLQHVLSHDRTNPEAWHALGLAHKQSAELTQDKTMVERAARFLLKAMDLKPLCPSLTYDTAVAFLDYSEFHDDSFALEYALSLFEGLLHNHAHASLRHPEWLFGYASALDWFADFTGEEKDHLRAIDFFFHALTIDPEFPGAQARIARNYVQLGHLTGDLEHYKKAAYAFKLAARQDDENEAMWLDWGVCLMQLGARALDQPQAGLLLAHAEQRILRAGQLGAAQAYYHLACLASLRDQTELAMKMIHTAMNLKALPPIEDIREEESLENLRKTPAFAEFLTTLEAKLQARGSEP